MLHNNHKERLSKEMTADASRLPLRVGQADCAYLHPWRGDQLLSISVGHALTSCIVMQRQALRDGMEELLDLLWSSLTAIARSCKNRVSACLRTILAWQLLVRVYTKRELYLSLALCHYPRHWPRSS